MNGRMARDELFEEQLFEAKSALFAATTISEIKFLQSKIKYLEGRVKR